MTSPPPPNDSKPHIRDTIRSGISRVKQAIRPIFHPPHPNSESRAVTPGPPEYSTPPTGSVLHPAGQVTGLSTLGQDRISLSSTSLEVGFHSIQSAGSAARLGLETVLRILEHSVGVFPPLKSAVSEFVACLDVIHAAADSREEYEELTSELTDMVSILNQHVKVLSSEDCSGSVALIARNVRLEVEYINKQRARGKARRILELAEDKEDVIKRYRQVEVLFRQLQNDLSLRTWRNTDKQFKMMLLRGMSPAEDARYNSSYSTTVRRHGCTPETREKVRAGLQDWVRNPNAAKLYWMNGMAGTGKTTIAYSLCEWLEDRLQLGASFFCSRASSAARNVNRIVPTIAYQLARYSPAFRSALCRTLEEDPDADKLNVVRQFEKLIQEPMKEIKDAIPGGVVVVIDALDECGDNYGVRLVLQALLRFAIDLPLKFFVTSRPEPAICDSMLSPGRYLPAVLHLHDIEQSIVKEDIKKYLVEALSSMSPPPSNDQIEQLSKLAGKLFIYAATAVRYILPSNVSADSNKRLNTMLDMHSRLVNENRTSRKYKELDELYSGILVAAFNNELEDEELAAMRLILRTILCAKEPMTVQTLASLLGHTEKQVLSALQPLLSVLHLSAGSQLVSTLHASFPDYMLDPLRSGVFHCNEKLHSQFLADHCFGLMKEQLRFNICHLESSLMFDDDVPGLGKQIKEAISSALFYACRYWGEHLQLASFSEALYCQLVDFLTYRLLYWMEVLNLGKCIGMGGLILLHVQNWSLSGEVSAETYKKITDARNLITQFAASGCSRSTPHIYISAFIFLPQSSPLHANYWGRIKGLMGCKGTVFDWIEQGSLATWHTYEVVHSVAFSPDGTRIVSGGQDGGIRVRDAQTGAIILEPLERHRSWVYSITFSPDGTRIASGSVDCTILVWDAYAGDLVAKPFEGHTEVVSSVAFSPDGTRIISGSWDRTVRVWDVRTGDTVAGPLEGHTQSVNSVAFSPDGTRIVSGSNDCTVQIWDAATGAAVAEPFKGHTCRINSVAFSPDGTRVVSGSDDCAILVWCARIGHLVAKPLRGHTKSVNSVMFSPDGKRIVSGSNDCAIQVWDVCSCTVVAGPFKGHAGGIKSVGFSPDGAYIISSSEDRTIRVWDASASKAHTKPPLGHTRDISSVALSPDGTRIVSGSLDSSILVWDMHSGAAIAGPFEGHAGPVYSVAFSPNGAHIASGSGDRTIRVWDAHTGDIVAKPFEGHASSVSSVVFSPDGARIVSGSDDHTIMVWDTHIGLAVAAFYGHTFWVSSVSFSPDGARILSSSSDHTIRVWNVLTGEVAVGPLKAHIDAVNSASFSPNGSRIVSGSADNTVIVWDAHTGTITTGPLKGHLKPVKSVAFSPNNILIASGSCDNTIRVWHAHTGDLVAGPFLGHTYWVNSVAFSPDCAYIVSGSGDRSIRVWAVQDRAPAGFLDYQTKPKSTTPPESIPAVLTESTARATSLGPKIHLNKYPVPEFKYHSDGWITVDGHPLIWTPPQLHQFLPYHPHPLVISPEGSMQIENHDFMLGYKWTQGYIPL